MLRKIVAVVEAPPRSTQIQQLAIHTIIQAARIAGNTTPILGVDSRAIRSTKITIKWIGLAEVCSLPGEEVLQGAKGAFVNVVALAKDEYSFQKLVRATMTECGLSTVSFKDIGLVEERRANNQLISDLENLAAGLSEDNPILFDEFQTYRDN